MTRAIYALVLLLVTLPSWAQQGAASGEAPATRAAPSDALNSEQFSDAVANILLTRIAEGFVRRNPKLLLSAFDAQQFEGYALFADRMRARLSQHDAFRAYFRIRETVPEDARVIVNVEWQIEQSYTSGRPPTRNSGKLRFTFQRAGAGWKIVEVAPRDLLTGVHGPA